MALEVEGKGSEAPFMFMQERDDGKGSQSSMFKLYGLLLKNTLFLEVIFFMKVSHLGQNKLAFAKHQTSKSL